MVINQLFVQRNIIESEAVRGITGINTQDDPLMIDETIIDRYGVIFANHPHILMNLVETNQQMSVTV